MFGVYVCFVVVCWYFVWFVALVLLVCGVIFVVVGFIVLLARFVGVGWFDFGFWGWCMLLLYDWLWVA